MSPVSSMLRRIGLQGYIVLAPWTAWLSLNGWLRPPIDFLLLALLASIPAFFRRSTKNFGSFFVAEEDFLLLAVAMISWISFSQGSGTPKSFNHAFSYSFVFGVFVVLYKRMWIDSGLPLQKIFQMAFYAVVVADSIAVLDWVLINGAGIGIRPLFIISDKVTNMTYYNQSFFLSVGGTSEEPSLFCYNVNALFPLGWYYLTQTRMNGKAGLFIALHIATLIMTASSGGIGFMLIALMVAYGMDARPHQLANLFWVFLGLVVMGALFYVLLPDALQMKADAFAHQVTSKMTFENTSADMREEAWGHGVDDFLAAPWLGRGPAYGHETYNMFGYQSWYWKLLAETGIFSLLLVWTFLGVIWLRIMRIAQPLRRFLVISFVASVLHWAIADCYYHVSFWIVVCLIQMIHLERSKAKQEAQHEAFAKTLQA